MGTPIICEKPLVEFGTDCNECTHHWLPGKTPKYVKIAFKDIVKCPGNPDAPDPPNHAVFLLEQSIHDPCVWLITPEYGWNISWSTRISWSNVHLIWRPGDLVYFRTSGSNPCYLDHENFAWCPDHTANLGTCHIWWEPDNIPLEITCHLGFHHTAGNRFDRVQCGIDHQVIRIANKFDKTNCLFYVDNQEFKS